MFGFFLALVSSLFGEVSDSIGKFEMEKRKASVYAVGFLTLIFAIMFFSASAFMRGAFYFSFASLPTFISRAILEVILTYITVKALSKANRSTFSFVRTITIPLLIVADFIMGYHLNSRAVLGMLVIFIVIALVTFSGKFEKKGLGLLLSSAIIPVVTLSLYKYDISNFNSVEAEQIIILLIILVYFFVMAKVSAAENPFGLLKKPAFLIMALTSGLAAATGGIAYYFTSPSIATSILRGGSVLFATLSGNIYFKEKKLAVKLTAAIFIIVGLFLLA